MNGSQACQKFSWYLMTLTLSGTFEHSRQPLACLGSVHWITRFYAPDLQILCLSTTILSNHHSKLEKLF